MIADSISWESRLASAAKIDRAQLPIAVARAPILIVDDYPAMLRSLRRMLIRIGFVNVYEAVDGKQALYAVERSQISLIISDLKMPGLDGIELLKRVRSFPPTSEMPFLLVTGNCDRVNVRDAIDAGVTDLIAKPFTEGILGAKLVKIFASL